MPHPVPDSEAIATGMSAKAAPELALRGDFRTTLQLKKQWPGACGSTVAGHLRGAPQGRRSECYLDLARPFWPSPIFLARDDRAAA